MSLVLSSSCAFIKGKNVISEAAGHGSRNRTGVRHLPVLSRSSLMPGAGVESLDAPFFPASCRKGQEVPEQRFSVRRQDGFRMELNAVKREMPVADGLHVFSGIPSRDNQLRRPGEGGKTPGMVKRGGKLFRQSLQDGTLFRSAYEFPRSVKGPGKVFQTGSEAHAQNLMPQATPSTGVKRGRRSRRRKVARWQASSTVPGPGDRMSFSPA